MKFCTFIHHIVLIMNVKFLSEIMQMLCLYMCKKVRGINFMLLRQVDNFRYFCQKFGFSELSIEFGSRNLIVGHKISFYCKDQILSENRPFESGRKSTICDRKWASGKRFSVFSVLFARFSKLPKSRVFWGKIFFGMGILRYTFRTWDPHRKMRHVWKYLNPEKVTLKSTFFFEKAKNWKWWNPSKSMKKQGKSITNLSKSGLFLTEVFLPFLGPMRGVKGTYMPFKRCILMRGTRICNSWSLEIMCIFTTPKIHNFQHTEKTGQYFSMKF